MQSGAAEPVLAGNIGFALEIKCLENIFHAFNQNTEFWNRVMYELVMYRNTIVYLMYPILKLCPLNLK
jgi:hypothetical protein